MSKRVVIDTGPLVAFLNRRDGQHDWAVRMLTLDGGFKIYRRNARQAISLITPR